MVKQHSQISLITELESVANELLPQPMWLVRPQLNRKYVHQRVIMVAEVVDFKTLDLADINTFDVL